VKNAKILAVHHLNCCTNQPKVGRLFNGRKPCRVVSHVLLVETAAGLILVDTGIGLDDMKKAERLGFMHKLNRPRLDVNETAIRQVEQRGFRADDVRHIIMTHLDLDHAGGLPDFPNATVHVLNQEIIATQHPQNFREKERYRSAHWAHGPKWQTYNEIYDNAWFGFDAIHELAGLPPEIILVRLPGHSRGHCGVAIWANDKWLLHAGDAYYFHKQKSAKPSATLLVNFFQHFAHLDYKQAMHTKKALQEIAINKQAILTMFCSHDTAEFESLTQTKVV
jgi:glyoxylase-like metal-dependent hydrolase (beta-lactamase superfamily II)